MSRTGVRVSRWVLAVAGCGLLLSCTDDHKPASQSSSSSAPAPSGRALPARASAGCGTSTATPGEQELHLTSNGADRTYFEHVPPAYDGRAPVLPDRPTVSESGVPGFVTITWFGLFAPAGTPAEVIAWANRETRTAFAAEPVRERYLSLGASLPLGSPDEFALHIAAERQKWGEVIRTGNIRME